jgi:GTP1/Obg family GTP-binding protein
MSTDQTIDTASDAFDASTEAIVAAQEHAAAQEIARAADSENLIAKLEEKMEQHTKENAENMMKAVTEIVTDALGRVKSRYVDTDRIPLLCQSVFQVRDDIKELKEIMIANRKESDIQHESFVTKTGEYWVMKTIVFTGAGLTLIGVFTLVLNSVLKR